MKNHNYIHTSLTRIADFSENSFDVIKIAKSLWEAGDYVVCKIIDPGSNQLALELPSGRMRGVMGGELVIGALGERFATLEATGTWKKVGSNGNLHILTAAGLMGKLTSKSAYIPNMIEIKYLGHTLRNGEKQTMETFVKPIAPKKFSTPVVLLFGTSMSAGKTTSARIVTNILKIAGLRIVGAKLSGAGRFKDILAIKDVGADVVLDFVDAGLPSTICSKEIFKKKIDYLKSAISHANANVAIIEMGASPLEPYNGDLAIEAIRQHLKFSILCASDPYAVYGLIKAYNLTPDIVTGVATNTLAGCELVENLCNVRALNLTDQKTTPEFKRILSKSLGIRLN